MPRNQAIDIIKIVAMFMVILLHTGVSRHFSNFPYTSVPDIYYIAGIAIPLFFMVSGYLYSGRAIDFKYSLNKIGNIIKFTLIVCTLFDLSIFFQTGKFTFSFPKCLIQQGEFSVFWYFGSMIVIYLLLPIIQKYKNEKMIYVIFTTSFLISTIMFCTDCFCMFEKKYICQTFRFWYWAMYFSLGSLIRKKEIWFTQKVSLWYIPLTCVIFVICRYIFHPGGNEYFFGSIPCLIYAICVFVGLLKININESKWIKHLSKLFLPVYALHMLILHRLFGLSFMQAIDTIALPFSITIEYILSASVIVIICTILMKIPYMDKLFKI